MTTPDDAPAPRDLTGTPGHAALREFWQVPPGGHRRERSGAGDILSNLNNAFRAVNERRTAGYEDKARAAWAAYQAGGITRAQAAADAGISERAMLKWWRKLGFVTR